MLLIKGAEANDEQAKQYPVINPYTTNLDELDTSRDCLRKVLRAQRKLTDDGFAAPTFRQLGEGLNPPAL